MRELFSKSGFSLIVSSQLTFDILVDLGLPANQSRSEYHTQGQKLYQARLQVVHTH